MLHGNISVALSKERTYYEKKCYQMDIICFSECPNFINMANLFWFKLNVDVDNEP